MNKSKTVFPDWPCIHGISSKTGMNLHSYISMEGKDIHDQMDNENSKGGEGR